MSCEFLEALSFPNRFTQNSRMQESNAHCAERLIVLYKGSAYSDRVLVCPHLLMDPYQASRCPFRLFIYDGSPNAALKSPVFGLCVRIITWGGRVWHSGSEDYMFESWGQQWWADLWSHLLWWSWGHPVPSWHWWNPTRLNKHQWNQLLLTAIVTQ